MCTTLTDEKFIASKQNIKQRDNQINVHVANIEDANECLTLFIFTLTIIYVFTGYRLEIISAYLQLLVTTWFCFSKI